MRTIEETLVDSKNLVAKIYDKMSVVETCEAISEKIKSMKICYTSDENQILVLDKVLDDEQMMLTSEFIIKMIDNRKNEAAKYLDFLNGKVPAIPNPAFEEAVKEMVREDAVKEKTKSQFRTPTAEVPAVEAKPLDAKAVSKLLLDGKTVDEIAEILGKPRGTIAGFMHKNKISKKAILANKGMNSPVLPDGRLNITYMESKIPEIKAMYTNGPFSLKDLSVEYGCCNKKELHDFLDQRGLLKISKKDPFNGK